MTEGRIALAASDFRHGNLDRERLSGREGQHTLLEEFERITGVLELTTFGLGFTNPPRNEAETVAVSSPQDRC